MDFRSTHPGKMHACGHDTHMAMLLGGERPWLQTSHLTRSRLAYGSCPAASLFWLDSSYFSDALPHRAPVGTESPKGRKAELPDRVLLPVQPAKEEPADVLRPPETPPPMLTGMAAPLCLVV